MRSGPIGVQRLVWRLALAAVVAVACGGVARADDRAAFIAGGRCKIVALLNHIHQRPGEPHRYLAIKLHDRPQAYVQCLLMDEDKRMLCEASSGFFGPKPSPLPAAQIEMLTRLGFDSDGSTGNHQRLAPITNVRTDFPATADLLLAALYDVYGARRLSQLRYAAPLAGRAVARTPGCDLISMADSG